MKLTVLGSGGWIPTKKRQTCAYILEIEDNLIFLDTDTNVIESTFQKSKHIKYLLHECWDIQFDENSEHSSLSEILRMARHYSIENIGLIHINPNWSKENEDGASNLSREFLNVKILNDGDEIIL